MGATAVTDRPGWSKVRLRQVDQGFCDEIARLISDGATIKQAARVMGVPAGVLRHWLAAGADLVRQAYDEGKPGVAVEKEGLLFLAVEKAMGERALELVDEIRKASKDEEWRARAWLLERFEAEDFGDRKQVDVNVDMDMDVALEGRAVVGLADVVRLAIETGQAHLLGLPAGHVGGALPPAQDVLPRPPDGEPAAGDVPAARQ